MDRSIPSPTESFEPRHERPTRPAKPAAPEQPAGDDDREVAIEHCQFAGRDTA
jgi:hypothetical protein